MRKVLGVACFMVAASTVLGFVAGPLAYGAAGTLPQVTADRGFNVVPTPYGLKLGDVPRTELPLGTCRIGGGCATRVWDTAEGSLGLNADFLANAGFAANAWLARRLIHQTALDYKSDPSFRGSATVTKSDGKDVLKVEGYLDTQSPPGERAGLRVLMVRDSARIVLIEIITWNSETVPASASFAKLTSKVQATLQKSWTQVPTVVLPAGVLPANG